MMKWMLALILAAASIAAASQIHLQTVPAAADGSSVDGIVQGPSQPFPPFASGGFEAQGPGESQGPAFGFPPPGITTPPPPPTMTATPTPAVTPTPVADTTATNDLLHPPQPLATAQCQDGWFSYSQTRDITCAGHGGVMTWIIPPGQLQGVLYQRQQEAAANAGIPPGFLPPAPPSLSVTGTATPGH